MVAEPSRSISEASVVLKRFRELSVLRACVTTSRALSSAHRLSPTSTSSALFNLAIRSDAIARRCQSNPPMPHHVQEGDSLGIHLPLF